MHDVCTERSKKIQRQPREQELNALRCQRRADLQGSNLIPPARICARSVAESSIRGMNDYGTAASGAKPPLMHISVHGFGPESLRGWPARK